MFNCLFSMFPLVYRKIFTGEYYPSEYFRWTTIFNQNRVFLSRVKLEKETVKTPLNTISIVYFRYARLFTAKFSRTSTILPLESEKI